jgi:uncharacterized membrane protein (UPF0127 family)
MTTDGRPLWVVRNATQASVLADRVALASSLPSRLRGLLGTRGLDRGEGMLIRPCRQVHSFFMRYALDLVFLDRTARVLLTIANFATNRISPLVRAADAVLELPAGVLAQTPVTLGDQLHIEPRSIGAEEGRQHVA